MSDSWLRYVPHDPYFRPTAASISAAESLLRALLPHAEAIHSGLHPDVQFVDAGANWSGVACPVCGADAEPWWSDAMSAAAGTRFNALGLVTPCCGTKTSLNDLRYGWPCGFGAFVVEAMNPDSAGLSAEDIAALSAAVGHPLREIPRHL